MIHMTIRGVPEEVEAALRKEQARRGTSLNRTVLDLLAEALGIAPEPYDNGLGRLAGTWTEEQLREFEEATGCFEQIDAEIWR